MRGHQIVGLAAVCVAFSLSGAARAAETRSIAGSWRVQLDPKRVGEQERWFDRQLPGTIALPGSTDLAHLGKPNPVKPTLDGLYRLYPYEGPAWYQYDLLIPGSWKGKRVSLVFERVHWETKVWIDGHEVPGVQD
ncbi:MAG: sugar-binding domain-containing protein, partial [Isosphaeraceae bacterium]